MILGLLMRLTAVLCACTGRQDKSDLRYLSAAAAGQVLWSRTCSLLKLQFLIPNSSIHTATHTFTHCASAISIQQVKKFNPDYVFP